MSKSQQMRNLIALSNSSAVAREERQRLTQRAPLPKKPSKSSQDRAWLFSLTSK